MVVEIVWLPSLPTIRLCVFDLMSLMALDSTSARANTKPTIHFHKTWTFGSVFYRIADGAFVMVVTKYDDWSTISVSQKDFMTNIHI